MSKLKIPSILNKIFSIIFFTVFAMLFVLIIDVGYQNESDVNVLHCSPEQQVEIVFTMLLMFSAFVLIYLIYNRIQDHSKLSRINNIKEYIPLLILIVCAFMFALQLAFGYLLASKPVTDVNIVNGFAASFAENGNFDLIKSDYMDHYMIKYQNNFAYLFILSSLYRISYLLTGSISVYLPIILNTFAINLSVVLTVFLSRRLFGDRKALFTLFLCLIFAPFYTYTAYYYTDSLSMPFLIGSLYLFVYAFDCRKKSKKYLLTALCGGLLFLSFKLKGSIIILLVAMLIYIVLKLSLKRAAALALSLVMGFMMVCTMYTTAFNRAGIVPFEMSEKYQYPYTHWLMIGLKGNGNYNKQDSRYTHSFSNKELKTIANIDKIKNRVDEFGVKGMIKHLAKKAIWTWKDGTYYISHHIENPLHKNILHDYILINGPNSFIFFAYSCAFQLFLILMMTISAFKAIKNPKLNFMTLLRLIVFGAFLFFLVWETRSRYLYNMTPLFIILSIDGLSYFCNGIRKKLSRSA